MYDAVIDEIDGRRIRIGDHWLVDFASCNYLGFDLDPEIMDAIDPQVRRWGTHPSWSRLLGNPRLYPTSRSGSPTCSARRTRWCCRRSPTSTCRCIPVLAGAGHGLPRRAGAQDHLRRLRDRPRPRRHAARASAPTTSTTWRTCCGAAPAGAPRLVCMDGVNSMTGNAARPGARSPRVCREYDALLYVDDAHGFGVIGERHAGRDLAVRRRAATRSCGTPARPTTTSCSSAASPRRTRRCWPSWPCRPG